VVEVPSRVATVFKCFIGALGPVISSMFITFQVPVVSGFQLIVQVAPSLEVSGVRGTGSALARRGNRARATTPRENIAITVKYGS